MTAKPIPEVSCESIAEIAAAVRSGHVTALTVIEESLLRIAKHDPNIQAFNEVWQDQARQRALAIDALTRSEKAKLSLAGVPFAVKGNISLTHPVIQPLIAAGAVAIGSTNIPQLCIWGITDSETAIVQNPRYPGRTAGGSSGGAAAAVAAGFVAFAQGNDGMGSLRIPAAACGLVTLKSSPGFLPGPVSASDWYGMSVQGFLTKTVKDQLLLLSLFHPEFLSEPQISGQNDISVFTDVRSATLGMPVSKTVKKAVFNAADALAASGLPISQLKTAYPANPLPLLTRWTAGAAADAAAEVSAGRLFVSELEPRNRTHVMLGRLLSRLFPSWLNADFSAASDIATQLGERGVLLTPALAKLPPKAGQWHRRSWLTNLLVNLRFAPTVSVWNLLGFAAGVVIDPLTGAPVQIVSAPGNEALVLEVMQKIGAGLKHGIQ